MTKRKSEDLTRGKVLSDSESFFEELRKANLSSGGFYISRADLDVSSAALDIKLIATVKFRFPDSLFVALRTRTGIEAGRLLLTGDTVLINDRINRQVLYGDPEDLERKYNVSSGAIYAVLGDFIGNPLAPVTTVRCTDGVFYCETIAGGQIIKYEIDCRTMKPGKAFVSDKRSGQQVQAVFTDFAKYKDKTVPATLTIMLGNGKGNVLAEIRNIDTEWDGNIGFVASRNYKKVRIR